MNPNNLKKIFTLIFALLLTAIIVCACGETEPITDENPVAVVEESVQEPTEEVVVEDVEEENIIEIEGDDIEQIEMLRMGEGGTDFPTPWLRSRKGGGHRKMMLIFDSLLEKSPEGLIPWLAKSYSIEDDGVTYIFTLRDNIYWHDGEQMTAEDVVFTFEYSAQYTPVSSTLNYDDIESVEAVDELTVKIVTKEEYATLLENIGMVSIVPKHVWEGVEDPYSYEEEDALTGSGPYILAERNTGESIMIYKANENFWGPTPVAKMLYWFPVSDTVAALEADEIDISRNLSVEEVEIFSSNSEFVVVHGPAFSGSRIVFNMRDNELLGQLEMRQAIAYALDSQELMDKLAGGSGELSNMGILPPDHIMYNPDVKQYDVDLEKAAELLDLLGYSIIGEDGIRMNEAGDRLSFNLLVSERRADATPLVVEQMARVGIEFIVTSMEGSTSEEKVMNEEFEIAIVGHAGLGGDADYLRERYAGVKLGGATTELASVGYDNETVIELLEEQRKIIDFDERREVVFEIQELMAEDVVEIMLYYGYDMTSYRPEVWDGWKHCYDERNYLSSKLSYLYYDQWEE